MDGVTKVMVAFRNLSLMVTKVMVALEESHQGHGGTWLKSSRSLRTLGGVTKVMAAFGWGHQGHGGCWVGSARTLGGVTRGVAALGDVHLMVTRVMVAVGIGSLW